VSERDFFLIDNGISTLVTMSNSVIPDLSRGSCVITGTAFDLRMIMHVDLLEKSRQLDSDYVDLSKLWG
jgi:hypothetical protein